MYCSSDLLIINFEIGLPLDEVVGGRFRRLERVRHFSKSKKNRVEEEAIKMDSVENPQSLVNEVITILASEDDKEMLENSKNILMENQRLQEEQEDSVKTLISKLTATCDQAKALDSSTNIDGANTEKIGELKTENSAVDGKIKQIEADLRHLEEVCKEKDTVEVALKTKNDDITNKKVDVLPKTKYYFSLFSNISHIRWDYNSKEDEIKGFVASLNDVKPFCLDEKQNSKYFTVNYLWDLIDA